MERQVITAAAAALKTFKRPDCLVVDGCVTVAAAADVSLTLHALPVSVTFAIFQLANGEQVCGRVAARSRMIELNRVSVSAGGDRPHECGGGCSAVSRDGVHVSHAACVGSLLRASRHGHARQDAARHCACGAAEVRLLLLNSRVSRPHTSHLGPSRCEEAAQALLSSLDAARPAVPDS